MTGRRRYRQGHGQRERETGTERARETKIVIQTKLCGVVPQCFKHALVKPPLKKASLDPNCLGNYRPVSSLPILSEVLERIVLKQFLKHFESHSPLEPFQPAYQKCYSTDTACVHILMSLMLS